MLSGLRSILFDSKKAMTFDLVADRNVSSFLDTRSFMMFRMTCRTHYDDSEAWEIRKSGVILHTSTLNDKKTLGLNYIMKYALMFDTPVGSTEWFQDIINWLDYKVSIRIVHSYIFQSYPDLMNVLSFSALAPGPRMHWQRLWNRYEHVYKKRRFMYDNAFWDDKSCKKRRVLCY